MREAFQRKSKKFSQIPCNAKVLVKMLMSLCRFARARAALSSPDADSRGITAACGPAWAANLTLVPAYST